MTRVGIFDSGIGGLGIALDILRRYDAEIIYLSDEAYHPYGALSGNEVLERCRSCVTTLKAHDIDALVFGCNTATAYGIDSLRETSSVPLIGVEPYINLVNHRPELFTEEVSALLVTPAMAKSQRLLSLSKRLDPLGSFEIIALPRMASLVQELWDHGHSLDLTNKIVSELKACLKKRPPVTLLGCTHYTLIGPFIASTLSSLVYGPGAAVAKQVGKVTGAKRSSTEKINKSIQIKYGISQLDKAPQWSTLTVDEIFKRLHIPSAPLKS